MEGINSVETSGEEQRDRITEMPDFILAHILSFLPTKDVVKMVLVPRFRHCWTLIRTLSFEDRSTSDDDDSYDDPYYDERFLNLVDNVLARHESSTIDKFHVSLKFNFYHSFSEFELDDPDHLDIVSRDKRMANKIRTWVHFAVSKKVKVLDLDLLGCYESQPEFTYKLPNFVLSSDHLTELRLAGCAIWPRGRVVELKSLKKLFLREIILSEKIMDQVLSGCPLLGELFLITCYGLRKLSFSNPSVKRLVVVVEPHSVFRLKISCPNVVSLAIAGSLQYGHLEDVSSLVDASISFTTCFKCALMKYSGVKMLLKKLGNTNTFAPCTWCILVLTIWNLTNQPCPSFCWKFLVLKISLTRWHLPGICTLLRNSHCLETLTIYVHPENHYIFTHPEAQWMQEHDFDGENYWNLEEDSFHCLSHHLRIVSIYGYLMERYVIELVEFLLKNAMVLETMVISTKSLPPPTYSYRDEIYYSTSYVSRMKHCTSEELHEFSQKLFNFPRGSTRAVIHFSG